MLFPNTTDDPKDVESSNTRQKMKHSKRSQPSLIPNCKDEPFSFEKIANAVVVEMKEEEGNNNTNKLLLLLEAMPVEETVVQILFTYGIYRTM
jgi:hypothetical protein